MTYIITTNAGDRIAETRFIARSDVTTAKQAWPTSHLIDEGSFFAIAPASVTADSFVPSRPVSEPVASEETVLPAA